MNRNSGEKNRNGNYQNSAHHHLAKALQIVNGRKPVIGANPVSLGCTRNILGNRKKPLDYFLARLCAGT
jgi:hypothetical protein